MANSRWTKVRFLPDCLTPPLGSRELACWVTDHGGFSVSESSVYRLLKRHGLIREVQVLGFPAGKESQVKTTRINEE